jgi:glycosyltransferase 2 family protein
MSANPIARLQWWKITLPALFGVAVSAYLIATTFNPASLASITFSYKLLAGLLLGALFVVIRDFAFIYKIRLSTGNSISWKTAFLIIMLWEFGSAVTPGAVGGIAFALFLLTLNGTTYGKSTALVLMNTLLDNLAFVVVFALLYLATGPAMFDVSANCPDLQGHPVLMAVRNLGSIVWPAYWVYVFLVVFLFTALFILPNATKRFFHVLARLPILHFASEWLTHYGNDMEATSRELKTFGPSFWVKMIAATFVNWMARFALPNALFFGFATHSPDVWAVYARQYVTWIFLVIPSTPGASGVAELAFMAMNCEFMPEGLSATITTVWRIYSYYIYLIIGAVLLRFWLKGRLAGSKPTAQ